MSYRTTIRISGPNRRFLLRLQKEAREVVGRDVPMSELVDTIVARFREEVESLEPKLSKAEHAGLPVQRERDWMLAAAKILLRNGL